MAQDLVKSGVELPALMTADRWKISKILARYTERQAADRGAVVRYYQEGGGSIRFPTANARDSYRFARQKCRCYLTAVLGHSTGGFSR